MATLWEGANLQLMECKQAPKDLPELWIWALPRHWPRSILCGSGSSLALPTLLSTRKFQASSVEERPRGKVTFGPLPDSPQVPQSSSRSPALSELIPGVSQVGSGKRFLAWSAASGSVASTPAPCGHSSPQLHSSSLAQLLLLAASLNHQWHQVGMVGMRE